MSEYTAIAHKCQRQLNIILGLDASALCTRSLLPSSSCAIASEWVACQGVILSFIGFYLKTSCLTFIFVDGNVSRWQMWLGI